MKLGGDGPVNFPLSVLTENGYIRIVAADGEWLAVTTGRPDEDGIFRQCKLAHMLVDAANEWHKKKKKRKKEEKMKIEQVSDLLLQYQFDLSVIGARAFKECATHIKSNADGHRVMANHALTMLPRMGQIIEEIKKIDDHRAAGVSIASTHHLREKLMRWLGFVQGSLWALGIYSIDDMRSHNRSK